MSPAFLADAVLVIHGLFIAWAALGVIAVWRWPRLALLHLPALAWAVWIEASGRICPLTPLENSLRRAAGEAGYSGGFIEHYLGRIIYPAGLTREAQWLAAGMLMLVNLVAYGLLVKRRRR
ncbi:DUF2784 domain-containing protein [Mycolicibacterium sp.]|jgi:hypothetical protein|uniref:DUF2784 domain-containing protein n=1 Tax=Mycolicibacterium sp. TaxID=2320850 RepID=UPI0028AF8977|nr:DUF2784 domain-containing protein [Mycolicibacterium sp.]